MAYPDFVFLVVYLEMPPVSRLYRLHDRMINECGGADGMRIGRGTEVPRGNRPQCHIVSHMT
jgi:hypothetical protein